MRSPLAVALVQRFVRRCSVERETATRIRSPLAWTTTPCGYNGWPRKPLSGVGEHLKHIFKNVLVDSGCQNPFADLRPSQAPEFGHSGGPRKHWNFPLRRYRLESLSR